MDEQKAISDLGASMRLGAYECELKEGSKLAAAYGKQLISERHRHRYEFNSQYRTAFEEAGFKCVGTNPETGLVEALELEEHPWYIGVQYHPEYSSTVLQPSPIFMAFISAISGR